jgi:hypothetical protein
MATVQVTETEVQTQVNLYRNMNNTPAGGTKVTISGRSLTDVPEIPGRRVLDEDVTALLTPQQLAQFDAILDIAEQYLKNKWNIP